MLGKTHGRVNAHEKYARTRTLPLRKQDSSVQQLVRILCSPLLGLKASLRKWSIQGPVFGETGPGVSTTMAPCRSAKGPLHCRAGPLPSAARPGAQVAAERHGPAAWSRAASSIRACLTTSFLLSVHFLTGAWRPSPVQGGKGTHTSGSAASREN